MADTSFAWVIEYGASPVSHPEYLASIGLAGEPEWSTEHLKAIRFCRKQDAEAVMVCIDWRSKADPNRIRIAEHGWTD